MILFHWLFLGIVQGLTEFLPVSSSGHLVFLQLVMGVEGPHLLLDVLLHLATTLAVMAVMWRSFNRRLFLYMMISLVPTAVIGLALKAWVESAFTSLRAVSLGWWVTVGILWFLATRQKEGRGIETLTWKDAVLAGCFQGLAVFPGVSRSGMVLAVLLRRGFAPNVAFEFAFWMSVPAILAASVLQLRGISGSLDGFWTPAVLGMAGAFVSGVFALVWLRRLVTQGRLHWFAPYCLGMGLLAWFL
ncbi:MAG: undecaprenyl-diphosphate phosphatase [Candidatus Omnitrophica bacterium]|nr:undecaprenyl-diphosphate phosphatase [Candidatus Omnitrophota bacterium]